MIDQEVRYTIICCMHMYLSSTARMKPILSRVGPLESDLQVRIPLNPGHISVGGRHSIYAISTDYRSSDCVALREMSELSDSQSSSRKCTYHVLSLLLISLRLIKADGAMSVR